jgi:hypothetical protein
VEKLPAGRRVPPRGEFLPTGVAWQHVFEEKYRNKNSTTAGVAEYGN